MKKYRRNYERIVKVIISAYLLSSHFVDPVTGRLTEASIWKALKKVDCRFHGNDGIQL